MSTETNKSSSHRWIENIHILLWLMKDACWAMVWKPGAIMMIVPTVSVAFYLLFKSRHNRTDVFHNAAVCTWITANSVWMLGEFYNRELRPVAFIFFLTGIIILSVYYLFYFSADRKEEKKMAEKAEQEQ